MLRPLLAAALAALAACAPRPSAEPRAELPASSSSDAVLPTPSPSFARAHFGSERDVRADTSETGAYVLLVHAPPVTSAYPLPRASYVVVEQASGRVLVREDGLVGTVRWLDAERVLVTLVPGTVEARPDVRPDAAPSERGRRGYTVNVRTGERVG